METLRGLEDRMRKSNAMLALRHIEQSMRGYKEKPLGERGWKKESVLRKITRNPAEVKIKIKCPDTLKWNCKPANTDDDVGDDSSGVNSSSSNNSSSSQKKEVVYLQRTAINWQLLLIAVREAASL